MKALNKKLYRDIWLNRSQFATIFIMTLLGVLCFVGIRSYMDGMQWSGDKYYAENNLQDIWLIGKNFTVEDLQKVRKDENINFAERKLTVTTALNGYDDVTIEANFIESNDVSKFHVTDGVPFDAEKDGIWLDSVLAKNLGIDVGDEIALSYKNYVIDCKVLGLVLTPDHVYSIKDEAALFPSHLDFGFGYLSMKAFPKQYIYDEVIAEIKSQYPQLASLEITADDIKNYIADFKVEDYYIFPEIIADVKDVTIISETKERLSAAVESIITITEREQAVSYVGYQDEINEGKTYSGVFTALFLFIAMLSVVTTMHRFVRRQRLQIGTLKALGVKTSKITAHYVSFGFYISLLASLCGYFVGRETIGRLLLGMQMEIFEVPNCDLYTKSEVFIALGVIVFLVTFVTYMSCRSILKERASEAIRVELPKAKPLKRDITQSLLFSRASFSTKWNVRDMLRNKSRTAMAVAGIVGGTMILVCAFGMLDTLDDYIEWKFEKIFNFNYKISLDENASDERVEELEDIYGRATSRTYAVDIEDGNRKCTFTILDSGEKLNLTNHEKLNIEEIRNDGVYITEKLAGNWGVSVGDTIRWRIIGEDDWYESEIIALNRDPQTQEFTCTRAYFESLYRDYIPDTIYTDVDLESVVEIDGVDAIASRLSMRDSIMLLVDSMRLMLIILIAVSVILGFVIIYNLGVLSFTEKEYQFATLKVLGFKSKAIKRIFIKQNIWITIFSTIAGLPLGYWMTDFIYRSALGESYDLSAFITVKSYLYAGVGAVIVALVVNWVLARKVEHIDMVSSLKGNE